MKMVISLLIMLGMFLLVGTKLISGASWSAYVLEVNGTGIDNVNVTAVLTNSNYVNSTLTNINGFFNLTVTDNKKIKLTSSKEDYLTDTTQLLPRITTNEISPFNITLEPELLANVTGKVTNSSGSGIENATISAIQRNSIINSTLTDSNGDYSLVDLLDGTYFIEASAIGYTTQTVRRVVLLPNFTTSLDFSLTPETISPVISNVSATLISSTEGVIIWQTDESANSSVFYGTNTSTILNSSSSTLTTSHLIRLSSLSSNTLYYYNVSSCDFAGNCKVSSQFNFTTSEAVVSAAEGSTGSSGGGGLSVGKTWANTYVESDKDISEKGEITKELKENERIKIRLENEIHYVGIIEILNNSVIISISSEPQQATLKIGDGKRFELTGDDFYDILIRLNGIENNNANITISSIHEAIPSQLFDIRLELESSSILNFSKLVVIVSFENFGTEPTSVKLLFTILNETGGEVYSEDDSLVVETEEVLRKSFEGVDLEKGKYTLILTTLYNVNVVDEFRQEFEIGKVNIWILYFVGVVLGIILVIFYFMRKFRREIKKRIKDIRFKRNLLR